MLVFRLNVSVIRQLKHHRQKCFNFKLVTFFHCVHFLCSQVRALTVVQRRAQSESEDMAGDSKRRKQEAIQKRVKENRAGLDSSEGEGVCVCVWVWVCGRISTNITAS